MVLCSRCGKRDALENGLCLNCIGGTKHLDGSISIERFKEKYLNDPASGIFFADDAILQYQSYKEDQRFVPMICGEFGGDYREAHKELVDWYSNQFFSFLEQKISAESTFNPIIGNIDYYNEIKGLFFPFFNTVHILNRNYNPRGSTSLSLILKKILVDLRGNYSDEEEILAANPFYVDTASGTFDVGSGMFLMDLFFLIRNRNVLTDFIYASTNLESKPISGILSRPSLMVIPWKHQEEAISRWLINKNGIVEMATATGKTVVGIMAIRELWKENRKASVLVICHRTVILNQWRREIIQKLGINANENSNYKKPLTFGNFRIQFETVQSVMKSPSKYYADLLIIDEVHHIAGKKYRRALDLLHHQKIGLTAQLDEGERKNAVTKYFGEIIYKYSLIEALKDGIVPEFSWIVHPVFLDIKEEEEFRELSSKIHNMFYQIKNDKKTIKKLTGNERYKITGIYDFIRLIEKARYSGTELPENWIALRTLLQKRRWIIHRSGPRLDKARDFANEMADNHKIIIFLMDTESCDNLAMQLRQNHRNVFVIHSKIQEDPIKVVNEFRKVQNGILLGVEMLNEGIDIPNADVGINVAFTKTQLQLVQRMGRVLRKDENKKPKFFHFVAVPDRSSFIEEIDAPEFIDDLSWVQDTAMRMGLDLDIALDSAELLKYKSESEKFIRDSYNTVTSVDQSFGSFNLKRTMEEFDAFAIKRIIDILPLYSKSDITDKQWEDLIRTAYGNVNEDGKFEKAKFVDVGKSWYILIIANRKYDQIIDFFSKYSVFNKSDSVPFPHVRLDENGMIDIENARSTKKDFKTSTILKSNKTKNNKELKESFNFIYNNKIEVENNIIAEKCPEIINKSTDKSKKHEFIKNVSESNKFNEDINPKMDDKDKTEESDIDIFINKNEQNISSEFHYQIIQNIRNGNIDVALEMMEGALQDNPDDKLIIQYKKLCDLIGRNHCYKLNIKKSFIKGKVLTIPEFDYVFSVKTSKEWVQLYESKQLDKTIKIYEEKISGNYNNRKLTKKEMKLKNELEGLLIIKKNIYKLKIFLEDYYKNRSKNGTKDR